jgi:hypothetical protein
MEWLLFIGFLVVAGWGVDRHLRLRDLEIAFKGHLNDLLALRNTAPKSCLCCLQSRILELKALIREHF